MGIPIPAAAAERAATHYEVDANGCHVSTYSRGSHGYAQVGWYSADLGKNQATTAHRAAWTHHNGPIPDGLTVDHECRVRPCVNIKHLRLLPNGANASDNGQVRSNVGTGITCQCGEEKVMREGATYAPYCRSCQSRRRRARRAAGKAN